MFNPITNSKVSQHLLKFVRILQCFSFVKCVRENVAQPRTTLSYTHAGRVVFAYKTNDSEKAIQHLTFFISTCINKICNNSNINYMSCYNISNTCENTNYIDNNYGHNIDSISVNNSDDNVRNMSSNLELLLVNFERKVFASNDNPEALQKLQTVAFLTPLVFVINIFFRKSFTFENNTMQLAFCLAVFVCGWFQDSYLPIDGERCKFCFVM